MRVKCYKTAKLGQSGIFLLKNLFFHYYTAKSPRKFALIFKSIIKNAFHLVNFYTNLREMSIWNLLDLNKCFLTSFTNFLTSVGCKIAIYRLRQCNATITWCFCCVQILLLNLRIFFWFSTGDYFCIGELVDKMKMYSFWDWFFSVK